MLDLLSNGRLDLGAGRGATLQEMSLCGVDPDRTYAEVEESEADLERFRSWLAKIAARDYFDAPAGEAARVAVEEAAADLAEFEQAALHAEASDTPAEPKPRRLQAVEKQ